MNLDDYIDEIETLALEESKQTLHTLSLEINKPLEEIEKMFLSFAQKEALLYLVSHNISLSKEDKEYFHKILATTNYWDYFKWQNNNFNERQTEYIINTIDNNIGKLPIDWNYLHGELMMDVFDNNPGLATQFNKEKDILGNPLKMALRLIPRISYFNMDFNVFISKKSKIKNLPAICVFPHLFNVVVSFIDNMSWLVLDFNENTGTINTSDEATICNRLKQCNNEVIDYLDNNIKTLLLFELVCKSLPLKYFNSFQKKRIESIQGHAYNFINCHEYGHLLMGHTRLNPSKLIEYQADRFSMVMSSLMMGGLYEEERTIAQTFVIFIIHLRESLIGFESNIYPTGIERISHIEKYLDNSNKALSRNIWESILKITNDYLVHNLYDFIKKK